VGASSASSEGVIEPKNRTASNTSRDLQGFAAPDPPGPFYGGRATSRWLRVSGSGGTKKMVKGPSHSTGLFLKGKAEGENGTTGPQQSIPIEKTK